MPSEELVTIVAGGFKWTAFERVTVEASFRAAARSFHIVAAAEPGPSATAWTFSAGTPVEILFNGDLALRGYVDRYQPKIAEHSHAEVSIAGRSNSQDVIDSSAVHSTGRFKQKTPVEIAQAIHQSSVAISTDQQLEKIDYQLTPGETAFRCLEKLCRSQAVFPVGQADGSILVTVAGSGTHAGGLIEGVNIKTAEADHNWSGRHSKVIVRGQRPYGHGRDALEIEAAVTDSTVGRNRPVILTEDGDTTKARALKRARHRRDVEAGNSLKASVTVQGFRDASGVIWTPGYLIWVESPFLDIAQMMAIETVTFSQSRRSGSESVLKLCDPRALGGKASRGGKANAAWASGAGDN